jgi:hypothetical protein
MPTNRRRRIRQREQLLPEERAWLTGLPIEGASRLWSFRGGEEKVERCRFIMREYAHLIPRGRRSQLLSDIERWGPPKPFTKLATFRTRESL